MRGSLFFSLLFLTTTLAAEPKVRHAFESAIPRGTVRRVVVDIPAGEIKIRNGGRDRLLVSGVASREPDSDRSREKQQRIVDDISVEIYASNEEAIVRRRFGPNAKGFSGETFTGYDLVITVPAGVSLELLTRTGEVEIEGSYGDIDVDLRAGEVTIRTPRATVRQLNASARVGEIRTNLGSETLEHSGILPRKIRFNNPSGTSNINVHVTAGEVDVELTR
jgi:hypothetical protein